jgi:hypothetical protein
VGHKVAEAIIENGEITYVDTELPKGKITVRIIYDTDERNEEPYEKQRGYTRTSTRTGKHQS